MNNLDSNKIIDLANKLLIDLNDDEIKSITDEFNEIDSMINKINMIDGLDKYEVTTHPFKLDDVLLNDDEVCESVNIDDLLVNSGDVFGREVKVPKVVNNE